MHPTTTGLGPNQGADALDEQFDEQFDYIEQDVTTDGDTANTGTGRKLPHITPKIAPPKIVKRYDVTDLPGDGVWVVVTVNDGKRRETLQGRVTFTDTNRLRIKQGAGWWDIPLNTVLTITTGDDPAHRGR